MFSLNGKANAGGMIIGIWCHCWPDIQLACHVAVERLLGSSSGRHK